MRPLTHQRALVWQQSSSSCCSIRQGITKRNSAQVEVHYDRRAQLFLWVTQDRDLWDKLIFQLVPNVKKHGKDIWRKLSTLWQEARLTCMKEAFHNKMSSSARKIFVPSSGNSLSRYGAQGIMVSILKLSIRRLSIWKGAAWWLCFYWIFPTPETANVLFPSQATFSYEQQPVAFLSSFSLYQEVWKP